MYGYAHVVSRLLSGCSSTFFSDTFDIFVPAPPAFSLPPFLRFDLPLTTNRSSFWRLLNSYFLASSPTASEKSSSIYISDIEVGKSVGEGNFGKRILDSVLFYCQV